MKTCAHCGGMLYRNGLAPNGATRYRCAKCGKSITVRNGIVSQLRGRPIKFDWRMVA